MTSAHDHRVWISVWPAYGNISKKLSVFLRMTFTYDSHVVAKPLGKTTLRMTSAYDFFTYGFAHDSAHDPRMATKRIRV